MYRLTCFGEVSVLGPDQRVIRLRSQKHIALLTYLAANRRRAHDRDALASLFWNTPIDRARHSLSQALYDIRKKLDGAVLRSTPSRVRFTTNHLTYDGDVLEDAVRTERFAAAVDLYEGGFAPGLDAVASGDFERWVEEERRRLDELARIALHKQIDACYSAGRWSEMYIAATKLVRLDSLEETAHRAVIQALWLHGDQQGALRHYDGLVKMLKQELEATPDDETTALVARIRGSRTPAAPSITAARSELPLVGRGQEFAVLQGSARATESHEARLIYLDGEAGIGKTRLVREFARSMELAGLRVLTSRCYSAESDAAYLPVLEGIREVVANVAASEQRDGGRYHQLGQLFPEYPALVARELQGTTDPETGRRRMYEEVADVVRRSFGPRTVWIIEDIHWIDASSASLLHYLLRRLRKHPLLLIVTARRHVELTEAARKLLDDARSNLRCDEIALAPLGSDEIQALIQLASPETDPDIIEAVQRYSGGNPFYALEIARSLIEARQSGVHSDRSAPITPQLRDLLALRVSGLDRDAARILESVAVLERYAAPARVARMAGLSLDTAAEAGTPLYRRRLLVDSPDSLGFPHDIVREFVYDGLGSLKRTALHLRAGELLTEEVSTNPAIVARHFSMGGDKMRAHEFALRAAEESAARSAHQEAARMAELAATCALTDNDKAAALKILARASFAQADFTTAAVVARELLDSVGRVPAEEKVDLLILVARSLELSEPDDVALLLNEAEAAAAEINQPEKRYPRSLEVLHWTLKCAWRAGDRNHATRAIAKIEKLQAEAHSLGCVSPAIEARAWCALAAFYTYYESSQKALAVINRAMAIAGPLAPEMRMRVFKLAGIINLRLARLDEAESWTVRALTIAEHLNDTSEVALLRNNMTAALLYRGRWKEAEDASRSLCALEGTLPGHLPTSDVIRLNLASALFYQRKVSDAYRTIEEGIELAQRLGAQESIASLAALRGLVCLQTGNYSGAREAWHEVKRVETVRFPSESSLVYVEWFRAMMGREGRVQILDRLDRCAVTQEQVGRIDNLVLRWLRHVLAQTPDDDGAQLLVALDSSDLGWFANFSLRWVQQVRSLPGNRRPISSDHSTNS